MVDEFSSFARLPKPVFRDEDAIDLVRQAVFLQEVAHQDIAFNVEAQDGNVPLSCDRHQFGQAMTNVLKNAVEAVQAMSDMPGRLVVLTPSGTKLTQAVVEGLGEEQRLLLLCGRYEGFDQRILDILQPE